jgi:hypothetical protein
MSATVEGAGPPRKPITYAWPAAGEPIRAEQAEFFASLIDELIAAWRSARGVSLRDLAEYGRLIGGAHACGFVCRDIDGPAFEERMIALTGDPGAVRRADFVTIRRYVHTLVRSERFSDGGGPFGGGSIHAPLASGTLAVIAERLENELEWRGD